MSTGIETRVPRILILDGAMGTMIQKYSPVQDGNNDRLNLDAPEVIARIHTEYIEAGADIIETNTFSSNRISQNGLGLGDKAREMAYRGAEIARRSADEYVRRHPGRKIYVAGSVGPTSKSLSLSPCGHMRLTRIPRSSRSRGLSCQARSRRPWYLSGLQWQARIPRRIKLLWYIIFSFSCICNLATILDSAPGRILC